VDARVALGGQQRLDFLPGEILRHRDRKVSSNRGSPARADAADSAAAMLAGVSRRTGLPQPGNGERRHGRTGP